MKILFRAAFTVLALGLAAANSQASQYHTPANNYYQNNWMAGG
jgi:hypothetical protein